MNLSRLYAPVDWRLSVLFQVSIGLRKMLVAEKSTVGAKGGRVGALQDEVLAIVNKGGLLARGGALEQEDDVLALVTDSLNCSIGEELPAGPLVATRFVALHGEH